MSYSSDDLRAVGRPRSAGRETVILTAVLDLLSERGYAGVSFEAVARRAAASKPTLYRRWQTKADMVIAAIKTMPAVHQRPCPDTGSLRGDLLALLTSLAETIDRADTAVAAALLQAGLQDPALCDHLETVMGPTGARLPLLVLERAVARQELPASARPFAYDETAAIVIVTRALNGLEHGASYREQLVDTILLPALQHASSSPTHAGIFSGAPTTETP